MRESGMGKLYLYSVNITERFITASRLYAPTSWVKPCLTEGPGCNQPTIVCCLQQYCDDMNNYTYQN